MVAVLRRTGTETRETDSMAPIKGGEEGQIVSGEGLRGAQV